MSVKQSTENSHGFLLPLKAKTALKRKNGLTSKITKK